MKEPLKVLTIAGSDSGGAAGLQADLKSFAALGAYGMSVVTVVTAQNSVTVDGVHRLPPSFVADQLDAVLRDYGAAGVKTGFIGDVETIMAVVQVLDRYEHGPLVVDPVLVNHRAEAMFPPAVTEAYRKYLLPRATVVTPNGAEAALLANRPVESPSETAAAARALLALGSDAVLVTGGRGGGAQMVDLLCTPAGCQQFPISRIETTNTHGSGDTLSAALLTHMAAGDSLPVALRAAQAFTAGALAAAAGWRLGAGHGPLNHRWGWERPLPPPPTN